MSEKTGLQAIIPSWKEIGFMVVAGFGLFLSVSGMAGITIAIGPLNEILGWEPELGLSKGAAFGACFGLCVLGGALDFFANLGLKGLEKQQ